MSEKIVQLNEEVIKGQIKELVRGSVEETLNELLEAEAEKLTQAARYERNDQRQGYRSGHYSRNLTTTSGDVTLKVPKLKGISFETAIIERYRRRESSVEEALIEMYLAGVSVRRVEDITEALWGSKVSPSTISELNKKAYVHIEDWRNRPLQGGRYPYVYVDGIYLRRNWGGEFENVAILVAIAVNEDGYREVLGAAEGMKEDKASWVSFFQWLRSRGLDGVKLVVGDKCLGMLEAVGEVFPEAKYQRCTVVVSRNFRKKVCRAWHERSQPAMEASSRAASRCFMFMYFLLPHWVPATWRSRAQTSMRAELPSGKLPTTRVRRRISRFSRSMTLLVRMRVQCSPGKSQ